MKFDRIIMIGPTESVLTKRGNRFPDMAKYFVSKGFNVHYITANFYHAEKRFFDSTEIDEASSCAPYSLTVIPVLGYQKNISVKRIVNNILFSVITFFELMRVARKGDVILIPSRPVELIFFVSLIRRIRRVKAVLDVQDIWPDALSIESSLKSRLFSLYCSSFLKPSVRYFDEVMVVTPGFNEWVARYAPKKKGSLIPLGWEKSRWGDAERYSESVGIRNIACVAQLQHQIDIMPVLEVLRDSPDVRLTIIGEDGSGERYKEVCEYIDRLNINNVFFAGVVARDSVSSFLKKCDVGILPMISSSLPNKIFDYLGASLPIIVLGDNDSSKFVDHHDIGWSCEYSAESLRRLISSISEDELQEKRSSVVKVRDEYCRDRLHSDVMRLIER